MTGFTGFSGQGFQNEGMNDTVEIGRRRRRKKLKVGRNEVIKGK